MKIFTHWVFEQDDTLTKKFFASKGEEEKSARAAQEKSKKVVARHSWGVEPTAKAVAAFCNEQIKIKEYLFRVEDRPMPALFESTQEQKREFLNGCFEELAEIEEENLSDLI